LAEEGHLEGHHVQVVLASVGQEDVIPQGNGAVPAGSEYNPAEQPGAARRASVELYSAAVYCGAEVAQSGLFPGC
ncbi:MAG: hypothetical protein ACJ8BF_00535, partial [Gemmatimonadales bacterium]